MFIKRLIARSAEELFLKPHPKSFATAASGRRQNRDPIELLKTVLLRKENTPLEKLYCPENLPHPDSS